MSIYIIAEIGINHNGSVSICKELIDTAVESNCNAVKFQKRDLNEVYTQDFLNLPRESQWGTTQREQKNGLEFNYEEYAEIDSYCKQKEIDWFASAWDINSLNFLDNYDLKFHKIASAMIVDSNFLTEVAKRKKHTFISTGMCEESDIVRAVDIFEAAGCSFELMHCVSTYPMEVEDANLNCIASLRDKFGCDVGYSGHEIGLAVSYAATALGITSLERHITISRALYGSDQPASVEPAGFRSLVGAVKKIERAMGNGKII